MIDVGGYIYEQTENGCWTFKAKEPEPLKKDSTLKAQYKELPSLDLIYGIEAHMRGQMDNEIKQAVNDIVKQVLK